MEEVITDKRCLIQESRRQPELLDKNLCTLKAITGVSYKIDSIIKNANKSNKKSLRMAKWTLFVSICTLIVSLFPYLSKIFSYVWEVVSSINWFCRCIVVGVIVVVVAIILVIANALGKESD